ncbi:MAG TPA: VCBS repeat-containing protein [Polyangiales bacterium]|nr:VCBS repeat-containing protein [Polyangiales bacterium]
MRAGTLSSILVAALTWCSAGCYEDSVVGTSGKREAKVAEPASASMPKTQSMIAAKPGENVGLAEPFLGDIDGDGFDDFLIMASAARSSGEDTLAYLYYGRPDFPAQLSTEEADAVFQTNSFSSGPLGDIDGDGLADFVLGRVTSSEIVFGSRRRLHGAYMPFSVGPRWLQPELPSPFSPQAVDMSVRRAGDLDGDGNADLLITGATLVPDGETIEDAPFGLRRHDYLVPGHPGEWPSETWDLSQAVAEFSYQIIESEGETYAQGLTPFALGDLDGDGLADLGVLAENGLLVFYGGREFRGLIGPEQADAHLLFKSQGLLAIGDADNDKASDLVAISSDGGSIGVYYGRRWSGELMTKPDLVLNVDDADGVPGSFTACAGDIDGDGWAEIVVAIAEFAASSESMEPAWPGGSVYVLRGTGKRYTGQRRLGRSDLLKGGPARWTPQQLFAQGGFAWALSMNGDVDGDGGFDILTSSTDMRMGAPPTTAVYLIPSTPRTPD